MHSTLSKKGGKRKRAVPNPKQGIRRTDEPLTCGSWAKKEKGLLHGHGGREKKATFSRRKKEEGITSKPCQGRKRAKMSWGREGLHFGRERGGKEEKVARSSVERKESIA